MHIVAGERAPSRAAERLGLAGGQQVSAADLVVFPGIMLLLRAMEKREAGDLRSRFLPLETTHPAIARWIRRVEALPATIVRILRTGARVRRGLRRSTRTRARGDGRPRNVGKLKRSFAVTSSRGTPGKS